MRRAGRVIREAAGMGRGRLLFLFGLAALIFIPLGVLDGLESDVEIGEDGALADRELIAALAGVAVRAASSLVGEVLYMGAVAVAVLGTPRGRNPSLGKLIRETRWPALIAVDLLFALGVMLGILLLLVPGVVFFARYVLSGVLAEIEELGVRDAFRRSAAISRGARLLVFSLIFAGTLAGDLGGEIAEHLVELVTDDSFLTDWAAAAGAEILLNPVVALLSVALALQLGARPAHGAGPDSGAAGSAPAQ